MTITRRVTKYLPAMLAFAFVLAGSWMLLPRDEDTADAEARVNVVMLTRALPEGATALDVRNAAEVRSMPAEAVADALQGMAPPPSPAPALPALGSKTEWQTPRDFLMHVMNDPATPLALRVEAARALLATDKG